MSDRLNYCHGAPNLATAGAGGGGFANDNVGLWGIPPEAPSSVVLFSPAAGNVRNGLRSPADSLVALLLDLTERAQRRGPCEDADRLLLAAWFAYDG
jgi:hypothetical protein